MHFFFKLLVGLFVSLSTFCTILELKYRFLEHFVDKKRVTGCACKIQWNYQPGLFSWEGPGHRGKTKNIVQIEQRETLLAVL